MRFVRVLFVLVELDQLPKSDAVEITEQAHFVVQFAAYCLRPDGVLLR
jgi:hypothetical protein